MTHIYVRGGYLYFGLTGQRLDWKPSPEDRKWLSRFHHKISNNRAKMNARIMPKTVPLVHQPPKEDDRVAKFLLQTPLGEIALDVGEVRGLEKLLNMGNWSPVKVTLGIAPNIPSKSLYVIGRLPLNCQPKYLFQEIETLDQLDIPASQQCAVQWWKVRFDPSSSLPQLYHGPASHSLSASVYLHAQVPLARLEAPIVRINDRRSLPGVLSPAIVLD